MALSCGRRQPIGRSYQKWAISKRWPSFETTLGQCHVFTGVPCIYWKVQQCAVSDRDSVCVIGQGRLYRPMMCLRSRSAVLVMFFATIVAVASDAVNTKG